MSCYSKPEELDRLGKILFSYLRLPFSEQSVPGAVMEGVLAHVLRADVLNTYDFVDVISQDRSVGWQVKSTKASTPVTWKRAKIPNAAELIAASRKSDAGLQALGDAVLDFCNDHAVESLEKYDLSEIGYARLVLHPNQTVTYFERKLCDRGAPLVFKKSDFEWKWSKPKTTVKKEQLPALHGIDRKTSKKAWAWHGLGENQLHFSGEGMWWPRPDSAHSMTFKIPSANEKMSLDDFLGLLDSND